MFSADRGFVPGAERVSGFLLKGLEARKVAQAASKKEYALQAGVSRFGLLAAQHLQ